MVGIEEIDGVNVGSEYTFLSGRTPGFYIINDTLWLVDDSMLVSSLFIGISTVLNIYNRKANQNFSERNSISEDFLLKVLAVAKEPTLIKDINGN
jgi:hypothetical protein